MCFLSVWKFHEKKTEATNHVNGPLRFGDVFPVNVGYWDVTKGLGCLGPKEFFSFTFIVTGEGNHFPTSTVSEKCLVGKFLGFFVASFILGGAPEKKIQIFSSIY